MAARKTGGLGRGLDALIPNKAGGPSKAVSYTHLTLPTIA